MVSGTSMDRHEPGLLGNDCGRYSLNGLVGNPDKAPTSGNCGCQSYLTPVRKHAFSVWLASDLLAQSTSVTRNWNSAPDIVRFDVLSAGISYSVVTTTSVSALPEIPVPSWATTVEAVSPESPLQSATFGSGTALDQFSKTNLLISTNPAGKSVVNPVLYSNKPLVVLYHP